MIAYRLVFEGALRVPGDGNPFPRSDTLTAAVVSAMAELGLDAAAEAARPGFAVSSAFPFLERAGDVPWYFLPRPLGSRLDGPLPADLRERWRRVRYVSPALFAWALGAEAPAELPFRRAQGGVLLMERRLPTGELWEERLAARRAVDRLSGQSLGGPVDRREVSFAPGAGLYFLARFRDRAARARFEAGLRLLGDRGLGRTAPFAAEVDEHFDAPATGKGAWIALSLYLPTGEEVEQGVLRSARYQLVRRRGAQAGGARRRPVWMVGEGARLGDVRGSPVGASVRVLEAGATPGPGHDVFRSGLALCIPGPRVSR